MKDTSIKILKAIVFVDVLLIVISITFGSKVWLYNTQIGFISATLVVFASMLSYRRMINTSIANGVGEIDDSKDVIDKLDDPHDLYSEDVVQEEENFADVVKEEKAKQKQNRRSLGQTLKDSKAAFSLYRLGAYGLLVLGFMYLNRHELLHIPSYIIALSLPPLIIVVILLTQKDTSQKENHIED
ncbi:hypothetical protein MNB_SV-5-1564 [hydrothermal vent metagenome]|uniref:Uncharacterized protein n=1 Tax=hydrothermal vent metagenome TaxID=652676 RepID=A0A1W1EEY4_9ZZZZ